jgi:uncharacterized repeat protein (TIGR01451 family)
MKKVISGKTMVVGITLLLSIGLIAAPAWAGYMYGEEEPTSQLIVDKQVTTPDVDNWQDNLPASQIVLKTGDLIKFRITIKNSGDKDLKKIQVTDTLPQYLNVIFNPGEYDKDNNQIKWEIDKLEAGEEKTFEIRAHIDPSEESVIDGTLCLINKAEAEAETGERDEDTASFCIVAPEALPEAGSGVAEILMGTGFASMIGLAGVFLRKFGRGEI